MAYKIESLPVVVTGKKKRDKFKEEVLNVNAIKRFRRHPVTGGVVGEEQGEE